MTRNSAKKTFGASQWAQIPNLSAPCDDIASRIREERASRAERVKRAFAVGARSEFPVRTPKPKKGLGLPLFLMVHLFLLSAYGLEIHVTPGGNEAGNGTLQSPFSDVKRALQEVRQSEQRGKTRIEVIFAEGRYPFLAALELGEDDGGAKGAEVVYRAAKGARVIFDGGIDIPIEACVPVSDPKVRARLVPEAAAEIREIDLKPFDIDEFVEFGSRGFGRPILPAPNELFVNGVPQRAARWPNRGRRKFGTVIDMGSVPRNGDMSNRGGTFNLDTDRALRWKEADDLYVSGIFGESWADDTIKVDVLDTEAGTIKTALPHLYGFKKRRFTSWCVVNLLEEIDEPGEFFLDRKSAKVYFLPPKTGLQQLQLSVMGTPFLRINGTSHLRIEGIIFENARGSALEIQDGTAVVIEDCTFRNLGSYGLAVTGGTHHVVNRCDIYQTGAGGVRISGGDRRTLTPARHLVQNCDIHRVNRWYWTYRPCVNLEGVGIAVRHNHLHHVPGQAILFHGNDHVMEYNEIDHCVTDMSDMGAIYTGRNPSTLGHVIRYNFFHHNNVSIGGAGVHGIYLDDDNLYTAVIYGNVFYKTGNKVTIYFNGGGGHTVANNIFVDCRRPVRGGHAADVDRAIGRMRDPEWKTKLYQKITEEVDVREDPFKSRYPYLLDTFVNGFNYGTPFWNNVVLRGKYDSFVDVEKLDFTLKNDAPALKMVTTNVVDRVYGVNGATMTFQPIPFRRIGLARGKGEAPSPIEPAPYFPPAFSGEDILGE